MVGVAVGLLVGVAVGLFVGVAVGFLVGVAVIFVVGTGVNFWVGCGVGVILGGRTPPPITVIVAVSTSPLTVLAEIVVVPGDLAVTMPQILTTATLPLLEDHLVE